MEATIIIKQIDNKWTVNGKGLDEMSLWERELLVKFIKNVITI